jgi:filamentous hemagglutinin
VVSSRVTAGDEAYLAAGDKLEILALEDSDYSLYDKKKKGSFGKLQTKRDEVTKTTHIGSEISAGGDLTLKSKGDQLYQVAELESGKNIILDSGGSITFEGVKDLHQESHEKTDNNAAWVSSKGKGNTDETLRQTHMTAGGIITIKAVEGLKIDIKDVNQQTVSQTIDTMVKADPQLAWLKDAETRGDVDWRLVKEIHESFKYDNSGLGPASQMIIAIVMAAVVGPAVLGALSGTVGTAWAAGIAAVASGAATNASVSFINNGGDLGAVFADVTSSEALQGYVVSGFTAGLTSAYLNDLTGIKVDPVTNKVISPPLTTWTGVGQFAGSQVLQGGTSALINKALGGDPNVSDVLKTALFNTLAAVSFNLVGDLTKDVIDDGSATKVVIHAMVGGLLAEATGGDFATGALAAGANEALIGYLDNLVKGDPNLLTMSSQIIGVLAGSVQENVTANTLANAAWVTKFATQFNRQLHKEDKDLAAQLAARSGGKYTVEQIEAQLRLSSVNGTNITPATDIVVPSGGIYDTGGNWIDLGNGMFLQNFAPADRDIIAFIKENTGAYGWTLTAQTGFGSLNDKHDWSKTPDGPGKRDPLTGYPMDDKGGYRVPVVIDGNTYTPRYHSCASTDCLAAGANIDFGDTATLQWIRAANIEALSNAGWFMGAASVPAAGLTATLLSNGSTLAGLLSGYLKGPEDFNKALTSTALSAGFEKFVVASGFSKEVASKASNTLGMANTWDKLADRTLDFFKDK